MATRKIFAKPSLLASERLTEELNAFGIAIPAGADRKKLISLYEKQVTPQKDNPAAIAQMLKKGAGAASADTAAKSGSAVPEFVRRMSTAELRQALEDLGHQSGPITETTRPTVEDRYIRLLASRRDLDSDNEPTPSSSSSQPAGATKPVREHKATPMRRRKPSPPAPSPAAFDGGSDDEIVFNVRPTKTLSAKPAVFSDDEEDDNGPVPKPAPAKPTVTTVTTTISSTADKPPTVTAFFCRLLLLAFVAGAIYLIITNFPNAASTTPGITNEAATENGAINK